ncbi:biliverdin-producing heme oxygenase [Saccharophagus degradans]|uniref:biliverdin-producing heme oxygenase n=1 Tax=Saccharophagus degradans TaxID=86304 RepID=UPI001C0A02B1|nr:biliverdin-producing heme oxygenase [Saccharophagus degradans]MBU2983733.1 biliverdin-producing heme oxygenase [Saccharophagus degradans]
MTNLLSQRLKADTNKYHVSLDQLPVLRGLMHEQPEPRAYEQVIQCFYHCFRAWQGVFAQAEREYSIPAFAKIELHLTALEAEVAQFNSPFEAACTPPLPQLTTLEDYLGYSYVLSGSHLGARVILKALQRSSLAANYRFDFYLSQSAWPLTVSTWPAWKAELDSLNDAGEIHPRVVIAAAIRCFKDLTHWFQHASSRSSVIHYI